jgi:hypothetical protein
MVNPGREITKNHQNRGWQDLKKGWQGPKFSYKYHI